MIYEERELQNEGAFIGGTFYLKIFSLTKPKASLSVVVLRPLLAVSDYSMISEPLSVF